MAQDTDRSLWVCAMHAMAPVLPQCANNAESLRRVIESQLMRSGDVEENPGPNSKKLDSQVEQNEVGIGSDMATKILDVLQKQSQDMKEQNEIIRKELQQQNVFIKHELKDIKAQLHSVSSKCQEVNTKCEEVTDRCNTMEKENGKLSGTVSRLADDIHQLYTESKEGKGSTQNLTDTVQNIQGQLTKLNDEIDRLEDFSRRDNLRFFGIRRQTENEDYDACTAAVVDALNSARGGRKWNETDIVRAHRSLSTRPATHDS
ncbi:hypothetical protein ACOMHN_023947 [Nucella lapillus]